MGKKIDRSNFQEMVAFRMFKHEIDVIKKIIFHTRDFYGLRKYSSQSHFLRCAAMKLIREEYKNIKVKKGRPKKHIDKTQK